MGGGRGLIIHQGRFLNFANLGFSNNTELSIFKIVFIMRYLIMLFSCFCEYYIYCQKQNEPKYSLRGESHIDFITLNVVPTLASKTATLKKMKLLSIFWSTLV